MEEIRILRIGFEKPLAAKELPAFRGAVIEAAGRENVLFHNHENHGFRYAYPLIQYKRIGGKPSLMCINDGVEEVYEFFRNKQRTLNLNGRPYEVGIEDVHLNSFQPEQADHWQSYSIMNWLALNQTNYEEYRRKNQVEQLEQLQNILAGNIKAFAKGIGWWLEQPLELEITAPPESRTTTFKNKRMLRFDTRFRCNVKLPNFIGLGKGVSLGYGTIKQLTTKRTEQKEQEAEYT